MGKHRENITVMAINIADPKYTPLHDWANENRNFLHLLLAYSHDDTAQFGTQHDDSAAPVLKSLVDSYNRRFEPLLDQLVTFHQKYEAGENLDPADMPPIVPAEDFIKIVVKLAVKQLHDDPYWEENWQKVPMVPYMLNLKEAPLLDFATQWEATRDRQPQEGRIHHLINDVLGDWAKNRIKAETEADAHADAQRQADKKHVHVWMRQRRDEWMGLLTLLEAVALASDDDGTPDLDAMLAIQGSIDGLHNNWHEDNPDTEIACKLAMRTGLKTLLLGTTLLPHQHPGVRMMIKKILDNN